MGKQRTLTIIAGATLSVAALAGCSSATSSSSSAADSVVASGGGVAAPSALQNRSASDFSSASGAKTAADLLDRQVISTGRMSLQAKDVAATRQRVLDLVAGWHGTVSNEQATSSPKGTMERTHLVLRVPSQSFDTAMTELARTGHAVSQQRTAEDVTTQVIDTNAHVQAKKRAVQQLEKLLNRATTLGQVIRLEGDISDRQAELESLQQQQAWLRDQTSMSTIDLTVTHSPKAARSHGHEAGLLSGLEGGWHALGAVVTGVLTALGAALPFAVVLAVIGVPAWLVRRRRTRSA